MTTNKIVEVYQCTWAKCERLVLGENEGSISLCLDVSAITKHEPGVHKERAKKKKYPIAAWEETWCSEAS